MGRKPHTEEEKAVRLERDTYKRQAEQTKKSYDSFVFWVVDMLKPSGVLPGLTDESYARQLIEELIRSETTLQQQLKLKEDEWVTERTELKNQQEALLKRIGELENDLAEAKKNLKELKSDVKEHGVELVESAEKKSFLDVVKKLFERKV